MKIMRGISICIALLAASGFAADEGSSFDNEGGLIEKPYKGKYIVIVNNQSKIPSSQFFSEGNSIEDIFNFPVRIVEKDAKIENAGVIVQVNESKTAPALLVAPETAWAGVNVSALATDNPAPDVLKSRIQKEIMRAYLYAAGVGNSEVQPCLMRQIRRAKDLDKYKVMQPGPSAVGPVMNTAGQLGIFERTITTYKDACEEGWAPAPTNAAQKAVWEKVQDKKADKADPTNRWKRDFPDKEKTKAK